MPHPLVRISRDPTPARRITEEIYCEVDHGTWGQCLLHGLAAAARKYLISGADANLATHNTVQMGIMVEEGTGAADLFPPETGVP